MKDLANGAYHQGLWEKSRRIDESINGRWNTIRAAEELQEAEIENDPRKAAEELIDAMIVIMGGLAHTVEQGGMMYEELDEIYRKKVEKNSRKYPKEVFEQMSTDEAIQFCRAMWLLSSHDDTEI